MAEGNKNGGQDFINKALDFFKKNKRMFDSISLILILLGGINYLFLGVGLGVLFGFGTGKIIAFLIGICSVYYIAANWKDIIKFKD
ncbi:hypothetical protein D8B46_00080 [Candidatus Gracilibacteria bacterium]|nr:MAG: hypothetical protein D8B46_00080 [Candidatus Gracilibacteria bacterium]